MMMMRLLRAAAPSHRTPRRATARVSDRGALVAAPSRGAMTEDEWSALDEELEKALSGKKGKKGKRDSVMFTRDAIDLVSSATGSETATLSRGTKKHDDPAVTSFKPVPPAGTAAPASAPGEALDEWSALDEELAKLEQGKKRRGKNNGGGGAPHHVSSTEPQAAPHAPPAPSANKQHEHRRERSTVPATVPVPAPSRPSPPAPPALFPPATAVREPPPADFEPDDASYGHSVGAHIVGTCDDMCPERERVFRERERELDVFERVETSTRSIDENEHDARMRKTGPAPATSASLCVKRFARIVDDPSPDTVRTKSALERTTRHLYSLLGGRADAPPTEWETSLVTRGERKDFDAKDESPFEGELLKNKRGDSPSPLSLRAGFLWDRLRGVRQDAALQNWCDSWMVARLEEMVRFAIATEYLLCEDRGSSVQGRLTHDAHLHKEQLNKTLATLTRCYRDARRDETNGGDGEQDDGDDASSTNGVFPNEPEMLCYQLLLRLGAESTFSSGGASNTTDGASNGNSGVGLHFARVLRGAPRRALESREIQFALKVARAKNSGISRAFFKLVESKECSYLQACCLYTQLNAARVHALKVASFTWNKSADADLFKDVGIDLLRLDSRFGVDDEAEASREAASSDSASIASNGECKNAIRLKTRVVSGLPARACVTAAAAAMTRACGLAVDEAKGTVALRGPPFVDPVESGGGEKKKRDENHETFRPRRERVVDAKAPAAKGGFFRWRALIEGKAGR